MQGILLMLLGAFLLSSHNVLVRVIFQPSSVFGSVPVGGWLSPDWSHSLLLFQLRTLLASLFMLGSGPIVYPAIFKDLQTLSGQRPLLKKVLISGVSLFVALSALYLALAILPAGIAITTFFMYPAVTIILAWMVLKQPPRLLQLGLGVLILVGVLLTTPVQMSIEANWILGSGAAILASVSYSIYGLQAQHCLKSLHPAPYSLILFVISLSLASVGRLAFPVVLTAEIWRILWLCSIGTGLTIWVGYLSINYGIRQIGVTTAFLISAVTPIFTVLLAWICIAEQLSSWQTLGVSLVALGIAILGISHRGSVEKKVD